MQSYFNSIDKPISFVNVNTSIPYKEYCEEPYYDDSIYYKAKRSSYINTVNEWLSYRYVDSYILMSQNDTCDEDIDDETLDKNSDYDDDDNCSFFAFNNDDDNKEELDSDEFDDTESITNQYVCKKIFDEIYECITTNGYEIDNYNQFKEDFIHYMYILSDNRATYE